ncbi:VOC family protein [Geomicrobium sp. JCM 19055]|uniref:VOC family protein n=1 Tax=Geomicrobium sp. JCM 19055 TaxID=1460649 RepID=UPI00045EDB8B|nr:VOC family protein [Geomicrobium sp. JCM 19055]GAJ97984.1 lactoylglutathione lyase [Geomicrobium sp. JCM 19055]
MQPKITSITITVQQLERAYRFYKDVFELSFEQILIESDHVAFFFEQGISVVLMEGSIEEPALMFTQEATTMAEVDQLIERARKAGADIVEEPQNDQSTYAGMFQDFDGYLWEVITWNM